METNTYEVYLYASGERFDAERFARGLPRPLRGEVRPFFDMIGGQKRIAGRYWVSRVSKVPAPLVVETVGGLLDEYRPHLFVARGGGADKIYAKIFGPAQNREFIFTDKIRLLLREIQGEIDFSHPAPE